MSTRVHPRFFGGFRVAHIFIFCVVLLCVSTFRVPCCDVHYDFRIKAMLGSSLLPVVCGMAHVLFMLFVFCFGYSGVQDILCCVFALSVFVLCLCTLCCQFLKSSPFSFSQCVVCSSSIYGFWLPLWYIQSHLNFLLFFIKLQYMFSRFL